MSLRAVLILVAVMLLTGITGFVALNNNDTLRLTLAFPGGWTPQVYEVIALAFVLGFAMTSTLVVVRSGQLAYGRWRDGREARARERIEHLYAQGLEALLGGITARAEERFREVLAHAPGHAETLLTYGEMLRGLGRSREAAELHARGAERRPGDMRPLFALAADWKAEGNVDMARQALEQVIAANPKESHRARRELRDLLMAARRWDEAGRVHESVEAAARDVESKLGERRIGLGIRYEAAREAQVRGTLREAEREYRAILRLDAAFTPASLALGEVLVAQGHSEDGVRVWRKGHEASRSPLFFARLEEHHLSREEPEVIIQVLRDLVGRSRSRLVPSYYLAKLYLRLEMIDEAESAVAALASAGADTPGVRLLSATILERRGRLKEAAATYRRVIHDSLLLRPRYVCATCKSTVVEAAARCPRCGDWGRVDVDVRDLQAAEELGSSPPTEWAAGA